MYSIDRSLTFAQKSTHCSGNWTICRQTNSRSVKSQTGQLVD